MSKLKKVSTTNKIVCVGIFRGNSKIYIYGVDYQLNVHIKDDKTVDVWIDGKEELLTTYENNDHFNKNWDIEKTLTKDNKKIEYTLTVYVDNKGDIFYLDKNSGISIMNIISVFEIIKHKLIEKNFGKE